MPEVRRSPLDADWSGGRSRPSAWTEVVTFGIFCVNAGLHSATWRTASTARARSGGGGSPVRRSSSRSRSGTGSASGDVCARPSAPSRRRDRPPRALLLLAPSAACQAWRAEPLPAAGAPAAPVVAAHARLTRLDGRVDELLDARVERDTVRGDRVGHRGREGAVAVPLDSVRRLEVRRLSRGRTLGLAAGGLALALFYRFGFAG